MYMTMLVRYVYIYTPLYLIIQREKRKKKFSFYPQVYNYHTQLMPRDHTKRLQSALDKTLY